MTRGRLVLLLALLGALIVAVPAGAARLITGGDVKNGALTGKDIRNGSLGAAELSPRGLRDLTGLVRRGARGPKGDKGDTGAQGERGPKGDTVTVNGDVVTGPQGAKGDKGDQGPKGERGDQGPAGPAGAKGEKGEKGDTGAAGPAGPQGPQGATGPAGAGVKGAYYRSDTGYDVDCDRGDIATGGGFTNYAGSGTISSAPKDGNSDGTPDGWSVYGANQALYDSVWVVCLNVS